MFLLLFYKKFVKIVYSLGLGGERYMPNMKNAVKKVKVNAKKNVSNNDFEASMKTAIKNVERAVANKDKKKAEDALKVAIKKIDKANSKGVVTDNYVARNKSRLTSKVNKMGE